MELDGKRVRNDFHWLLTGGIIGVGLSLPSITLTIIGIINLLVNVVYSMNPDMDVWRQKEVEQ